MIDLYIYLRRRGLNSELVADTCKARDAPCEGLDRVPAETQFHFPLCLSVCEERDGALWREGRNEFVVGLNGGPTRGIFD